MRETRDDLIRARLPVEPVTGVPEVRLHRAGPRSALGSLLAEVPDAGPPYWAHGWAGGRVLARYVLDRHTLVEGRSVLDLGCGSGLVAIAAAIAGARSVEAVDICPWAVAATRVNAALNGAAVAVRCADLLGGDPPPIDLVLVGDLFYEAALARRVGGFLDRCVAAGVAVLVGDPGRAPLPGECLQAVHREAVVDFGGTVGGATVYAYRGFRGAAMLSGSPPSET